MELFSNHEREPQTYISGQVSLLLCKYDELNMGPIVNKHNMLYGVAHM